MDETAALRRIVEAGFRLAAETPWSRVSLADIAAGAGMDLAELARHVSSKADVLIAFSRQVDQALLASLAADPVQGEPHDRLFDIMLRRIELMAPYKRAIAAIVEAPAPSITECAGLMTCAAGSQGWTLAAAGLESDGPRGDIRRLGLAKIHADTVRVWLSDDDPGMARTMAALDRKLRDAETWARRFETPIAMAASLIEAWRIYRSRRDPRKPTDDASHATAD